MIHRDPRVRDSAYMGWIARLPCVACMVRHKINWSVQVAHLRAGSLEHGKRPTGGAEKPSDRWTTPLCMPHHQGDVRSVAFSQDDRGELVFWERLGINPFALCIELRAAYERMFPVPSVADGVAVITRHAAQGRRAIAREETMDEPIDYTDDYKAKQASGELPTVALSIMQPWASLIAFGLKDIENRTWKKKHPAEVLIHAGRNIDQDAMRALKAGYHPVTGEQLYPNVREQIARMAFPTGGIVGVAKIAGVVEQSMSPWFVGPYGYKVEGRPLGFHPMKGALGFFDATVR